MLFQCVPIAIATLLAARGASAFPIEMNIDNKLAMRALQEAVERRSAGIEPGEHVQAERRDLIDGLTAISNFVQGGGGTPYRFNFGTLPLTDTINIPIAFDVPGVLSTGKKAIPQSLFVAPTSTDVRGGCPGLNIMANYGFLDHSGITTPGEIIYALSEMLGNTIDIALGLVGVAFKAGVIDLTTMKFSIGRTDPRTSGPLSGILGPVVGLFSKEAHNRFEVDGSTAYSDSYFNPKGLNATRFGLAYARAEANGGLFNDVWTGNQKYAAWQECIANNPTCTWTPPETVLFYAAQAYAELTMPSADTGVPNPPGLAAVSSFWGYNPATKAYSPETLYPGVDGVWYRRATPINAANLVRGGLTGYFLKPTEFGSNDGKNVNTFSSITNPIQDLTQAGAACFIINEFLQQAPTSYGALNTPLLSIIEKLLAPAQAVLGCTNIE